MDAFDTLLSFDPATDDLATVEHLVARYLHEAGAWPSPRTSDGISSCHVRERSIRRVRVCGRIWSIDQVLHSFWLDVEREPDGETTWSLYCDPIASTERRARNAIDAIDDPSKIEWEVSANGRA